MRCAFSPESDLGPPGVSAAVANDDDDDDDDDDPDASAARVAGVDDPGISAVGSETLGLSTAADIVVVIIIIIIAVVAAMRS